MSDCKKCGWSGHPVYELQAGRHMVPQCAECSSIVDDIEAIENPVDRDGAKTLQVVPVETANSKPTPAIPGILAVKPVVTGDFLSLAKSRLAELDLQIVEMQKLQDEASMLRRMIVAAELS